MPTASTVRGLDRLEFELPDGRVDAAVEQPRDLRAVTLRTAEQRLGDPALRERAKGRRALGRGTALGLLDLLRPRRALAALDQRAQFLVAVARVLDAHRRIGADRDLLALAVQVVLVAPDLGAATQHLDEQPAAVGQAVGLVARLGVVDRRRPQRVIDMSHRVTCPK
jgi:hypothetical protein